MLIRLHLRGLLLKTPVAFCYAVTAVTNPDNATLGPTPLQRGESRRGKEEVGKEKEIKEKEEKGNDGALRRKRRWRSEMRRTRKRERMRRGKELEERMRKSDMWRKWYCCGWGESQERQDSTVTTSKVSTGWEAGSPL